MEKEEYSNATTNYEKASSYKPNDQFTPSYLMKLGLSYELSGDAGKAKEAYEELVKEYPQSREVNNAKKAIAALSKA